MKLYININKSECINIWFSFQYSVFITSADYNCRLTFVLQLEPLFHYSPVTPERTYVRQTHVHSGNVSSSYSLTEQTGVGVNGCKRKRLTASKRHIFTVHLFSINSRESTPALAHQPRLRSAALTLGIPWPLSVDLYTVHALNFRPPAVLGKTHASSCRSLRRSDS